MYQKYHTEALVLGNRERGENDRVFTLYTEEFGLVRARASAVRTEASRMRYALQNYSRARVALVRGKRGWRIGGAIPARNAGG
ncbi:MAG: repair protein RecO protein, partial [Candidatus Kaiserbacteria bacterium GW2011_GWA2_58_9]